MTIEPLGDSAFLITLGTQIDAKLCEDAQEITRRIAAARLPWVVELVPSYASVAVFIDPLRAMEPEHSAAVACIRALERVIAEEKEPGEAASPRLVEIPVRYGGECGPDLGEVAAHARMDSEEVIRQHARAEYTVGCIGFTPGFPYLIGLPQELAIPRRAVPRREVPAGSVAIGGAQTGIYPQRSPGGWHLIGRTTLRLFSVDAEPPALLQAGDRVRFISVP